MYHDYKAIQKLLAASTGSKNTSAKNLLENTHVEMCPQAQLQVSHGGGLARTRWGQFGI